MRLLIDADPGHDDLIAIAVAQQLAEIALVTTVWGNAPLSETTTNALVAVDLVGFGGPVVSGADRPREREPIAATSVHGDDGLPGAERPAPRRGVSGTDAARAIVDHAAAGTWLVAIGPLTNVAAALDHDPSLAGRLAGISIMGGAIGVPGTPAPVSEFNICADPEAADIVLRSGARLVLCPLDLTTQVRYDAAWVDSITQPYVRDLLRHYLHNHHYTDAPGAPLHDPCALLAVARPELFGFEEVTVAVERAGVLTRGMTVVDRRPSAGDPNVSLARTVDAPAVLAIVRDVVNGL